MSDDGIRIIPIPRGSLPANPFDVLHEGEREREAEIDRLRALVTEQAQQVARLQVARIGDSDIIGRWMCRTEAAEAAMAAHRAVERAALERARAAEAENVTLREWIAKLKVDGHMVWSLILRGDIITPAVIEYLRQENRTLRSALERRASLVSYAEGVAEGARRIAAAIETERRQPCEPRLVHDHVLAGWAEALLALETPKTL